MFYTVIKFIVGFFMRIFYRINVNGNNNPSNEERYLLVSNHASLLDPVILGIVFKPQLHFMAKKELFQNKLLAKIISGLNAFPVNRTGNDIGSVKNAIKLIKEGKIFGIFIEGTRVNEHDPANAKSGPILIAKMSRAKIIPVYIESNYKLFSKINVYIKEPYEVVVNKDTNGDNYQEQARKVLDIIYNG